MYVSISGRISLDASLDFSESTSILELDGAPPSSPALPIASSRKEAVELELGYVSTMTSASTSDVRCLRMEDIERRTRRVNLGSKWATARSRREKLFLMSASRSARDIGTALPLEKSSATRTLHGLGLGIDVGLTLAGIGVLHAFHGDIFLVLTRFSG